MNRSIKYAGILVNLLFQDIEDRITVGNTGKEINAFAEEALKWFEPKARLACKGFQGFPASICVSINEEIIHGIPDNQPFIEEDVIKVDLVVEYNGWFADSARTFICGKGREEDKKLVKVTKECLYKAIEIARAGNTTGDIGFVIEKHATRNNFSVMKEYSGHGIGKVIHKEPKVPCFGKKRKGYKLKEGDLICIEPMLFAGSSEIIKSEDGWTLKSKDNSLAAHFEHTLEITKNKAIIIT